MPGPSNKQKKQKGKGTQRRKERLVVNVGTGRESTNATLAVGVALNVEEAMSEPPFIHDPGNGPRVKNVKVFLKSPFARPVAQDDALCQEFGQHEVLEMLMTILPEDTALILWYNKSRATSRICPACLRLYSIGDELADPLGKEHTGESVLRMRQLREQELSGLCSSLCFLVAAADLPREVTTYVWGQKGEEMSESSWAALDGLERYAGGNELRQALGLTVKMTRLDDLGLLELCFE